jgi:hypothetical protein
MTRPITAVRTSRKLSVVTWSSENASVPNESSRSRPYIRARSSRHAIETPSAPTPTWMTW